MRKDNMGSQSIEGSALGMQNNGNEYLKNVKYAGTRYLISQITIRLHHSRTRFLDITRVQVILSTARLGIILH